MIIIRDNDMSHEKLNILQLIIMIISPNRSMPRTCKSDVVPLSTSELTK